MTRRSQRWSINATLAIAAAAVGASSMGQTAVESRPDDSRQVDSRPAGSGLVESGKIKVGNSEVRYRIRTLPVSSFPELPVPVADALNARGCVIPQTYQAKRPENVIRGSFEKRGSDDWAVLCSMKGQVSLLVFFASESPLKPAVLESAPITDRLQDHDLTGEQGFNWGVDPASPKQLHDAQAGLAHRPPAPDHDAIADSIVDRRTVYHLYRNGGWETIAVE